MTGTSLSVSRTTITFKFEQGRSQNFKQVPQNFMKIFNVDDVTLTSQIMTSYRKINIASEKIINYRFTYPSNHCCQIHILAGERPGITLIICCFLFLSKDVLLNRIKHEYICCDTNLVIDGFFWILNSHKCHLRIKRDRAV